jgi:hypothetical protein
LVIAATPGRLLDILEQYERQEPTTLAGSGNDSKDSKIEKLGILL